MPWGRAKIWRLPVALSGETKNRGSCGDRGPGTDPWSAALRLARPQTPSSALRGRPSMDIMEPRRVAILREFSRRLEVLVFIGAAL